MGIREGNIHPFFALRARISLHVSAVCVEMGRQDAPEGNLWNWGWGQERSAPCTPPELGVPMPRWARAAWGWAVQTAEAASSAAACPLSLGGHLSHHPPSA